MQVLVTGATGFLGKSLVGHLRARGDQVIALGSRDADLRQPDALDRWGATRYDRIYHLAAWTQAGDFCLTHAGEQWIINQQMNTHMLAWWHHRQPQAKLITIGTSCSFDPNLPLTEDQYLTGKPIESLFTYGMTKRMLFVGQLALAKQFGLKSLTVVPSTLHGPGYHTDGRQMHFIFDLIRKILRAKLYGEPVVLWGNGHQKREIVHVDDFVTTMLTLEHTVDNDLVNIGAGEEHSIREFAGIICEEVGFDANQIEYDTSRYVGATSKCLDVSKLRRLIPNYAPKPLRDSLRSTIEWFLREKATTLPPP